MADHSTAATKALTQIIRDAVEETESADDVWASLEQGKAPKAGAILTPFSFKVENDELIYEITVSPVLDD